MTPPEEPGPAPDPPDGPEPDEAARYAELRRLLLGPEQERIEELAHRLDEGAVRAEELAGVLPEAILTASGRGDRLGSALAPTVEEALQVSIRRSPEALADAVSPIMGPAIRRSDAATGTAELNAALAERRARALLDALPASAFPRLDFRVATRIPGTGGADARSAVLSLAVPER